jgi:hypothetical protein
MQPFCESLSDLLELWITGFAAFRPRWIVKQRFLDLATRLNVRKKTLFDTDVLVDASTQKFAAQAIKKMHEIGWKPMHLLTDVSASIGAVMKPAGFEAAEGILSAGYLKDAADPQWKDDAGMKKFMAFIDKYMPGADKADGAIVYGYGAAQTLVKVLQMCGDDLTRANVMKQAASLKDFTPDTLLPGITINTSATDFAPIEQLKMMTFSNGKWDLFGDIINAATKR